MIYDMTEAEFPQIVLKHPEGEHTIQVTPEWKVSLDNRVISIDIGGAVILNSLISNINSIIPTSFLWEDIREHYPGNFNSSSSATSMLNSQISLMQRGLRKYDRLGSVRQHIFRLGGQVHSRVVMLEDVTDSDFGVEQIIKSFPEGTGGGTATYYTQSFLATYKDTFGQVTRRGSVTSSDSNNSEVRIGSEKKQVGNTRKGSKDASMKEREYAGLRMSRQEQHAADMAATYNMIKNSKVGSIFYNDELTDGTHIEGGQKKANFDAIRELIKRGHIIASRDEKGRTIFIRYEEKKKPTDVS